MYGYEWQEKSSPILQGLLERNRGNEDMLEGRPEWLIAKRRWEDEVQIS